MSTARHGAPGCSVRRAGSVHGLGAAFCVVLTHDGPVAGMAALVTDWPAAVAWTERLNRATGKRARRGRKGTGLLWRSAAQPFLRSSE